VQRFGIMASPRPHKLKTLAINVALAVTLAGSLGVIVWARLTGFRIDDLIRQAVQARGAGDISAFEGYREAARVLVQLSQNQQPWLFAAYLGVGLVLVAGLSNLMAKVRTPAR
jgi:hypothetical protein